MINTLLNASIAGGIVILLWYLSYPLSKKYFKASWHYIILKTAILFLIVPVSTFAPILNNMLAGLSAKPELSDIAAISGHIQTININTETINSAFSGIVFPENINYEDNTTGSETKNTHLNVPYLQLIWLTVAAVLIIISVCKMHRFKKQLLNISNSNVERDTQELFLQCKEQLKVRGRINLRTSSYIQTPLVFGVIRPVIVFPETDMSADEKRLALIHELTHIKNGDLWIKFAACVISAVHWFNPFAYLLRRNISVISEEYCDECVVKNMTKEEKFLYGSLILKVVSNIAVAQAEFCSTLAAPTKSIKNIKRRLSNMMNVKKSRKSMIALSIIAAFILCSLATIYAFAANSNDNDNDTVATDDINLTAAEISVADTNDTDYADYTDDSEGESLPQEEIGGGDITETVSEDINEDVNVAEIAEKIKNNKRFCADLEAMFNQLISEQELTGTFEDFINETALRMAWLKNIEKYAEYLDKGISSEELYEKMKADDTVPSDVLENFEKSMEKYKGFKKALEGNDNSSSVLYALGLDGQAHKVRSSDIKVLTYEEYEAWLEEFKAELSESGKSYTLTNGNGEESIVSSDEMYEAWASIREQVKNGTTQFKQVIVDGEVVAWGDFEF